MVSLLKKNGDPDSIGDKNDKKGYVRFKGITSRDNIKRDIETKKPVITF